MSKKTGRRSNADKEVDELEQSYKKVTGGKYAKKTTGSGKGRKTAIIAICAVIVLIVAGVGFGYFYFGSDIAPGKILDNVTVLGVDIGGMSREEAVSAVQAEVDTIYGQNTMVVQMLEHSAEIPADVSGIAVDAQGIVDLAYSYGRSGSSGQRKSDQMKAMSAGIDIDITPYLSVDEDAIRSVLEALAENYDSVLTQPSYELTGERPSLTEEPDENDPAEQQTLVITLGNPEYDLDLDALYALVMDSYNIGSFRVVYDCTVTEPDAVDLEAIYAELCVDPVDAELDMTTFEISHQSYGYRFDMEAAALALEQAQYAEVLEFPFSLVSPEVTYEALSSLLFRDVLGSYTAVSSSSANRDTNLKLACQALNGVVLAPGESFSYNGTLGERTAAKGYKPAASYVGGETVNTYGGGICQVSSSLYYACLVADMEIVERHAHMYASSYVPLGMDATVDWSGPDYKFKNNTAYPIRIEAYASGGTVTVKLIGTDTKNYYVKLKYELLETYDYKVVDVEMEANNEKGYKNGDVITTPYTGYKAKAYSYKYSKETGELLSKDLINTSTYNSRNKKVCKIVQAETTPPETTPPETTAPPETNPPETTPPETTSPETTPPESTPTESTAPPESSDSQEPGVAGSGGGIEEG